MTHNRYRFSVIPAPWRGEYRARHWCGALLSQRRPGCRVSSSGSGFALDGYGVAPDGAPPGSRCSVSEIGRDEELPLGANRHELKGLGPALDDSVHREGGRLAATVGAVELGPIDQYAPVIAYYRVIDCGLLSVTRLQDLVLKAARQSNDSLFGLIHGQERLFVLLVFLGELLRGEHLFRILLVLQFREDDTKLLFGQERLAACKGVLEPLDQET